MITWRSLHELYSGIIGKSLIVISLATPVSVILDLGIKAEKYTISLGGALVIAAAFVITKIKTPSLIMQYETSFEYAQSILDIYKKKALDLILEFKVLESRNERIPSGMTDDYNYFTEFKDIDKYIVELGDSKAVRNMALIKYEIMNKDLPFLRVILFSLFIIGLFCLYMPLCSSIYKVFLGVTIQ
jgi:hypothetical protein